MITRERLQELLDYDPATGLFYWREGNKRKWAGAARPAGSCDPSRKGRRRIEIDGGRYSDAQLQRLWETGSLT